MIIRTENDNLTSQNFTKAFMLILALFIAHFLMCGVAQAAETKEEIKKRDAMVNRAINDLKTAIETRDFSRLRYDVPEEKPLSWSSPDRKSESRLSFGEMINKLAEISKNSNIIINEIPLQTFGITVIETRGWKGAHPYLYFQFKEVGGGLMSVIHNHVTFVTRKRVILEILEVMSNSNASSTTSSKLCRAKIL